MDACLQIIHHIDHSDTPFLQSPPPGSPSGRDGATLHSDQKAFHSGARSSHKAQGTGVSRGSMVAHSRNKLIAFDFCGSALFARDTASPSGGDTGCAPPLPCSLVSGCLSHPESAAPPGWHQPVLPGCRNLQSLVDQVLLCRHDVGDVPEPGHQKGNHRYAHGSRSFCSQTPPRFPSFGSASDQLPDRHDVLIPADRTHHLSLVFGRRLYPALSCFFLWFYAAVTHEFPFPLLLVLCRVGVIIVPT